MAKSLNDFREQLAEALTKLLWRQWSALGVASFVEPQKTLVIDPEALWLATAYLRECDQRLYGVAETWILKHRDLWMRSRYKKLLSYYQETQEKLWGSGKSVPLSSVELRRNSTQIRERQREVIRPLPLNDPSLIRLKLRGIFGRETRSEVFLYFLYHREGTSLSIAKEFFLEQKSVYNVAQKWHEAGILEKRERKKTGYVMPDLVRKAWLKAFRIRSLPQYLNWGKVFTGLCLVVDTLGSEPWKDDAYLCSSFYRDVYPSFAELWGNLRLSPPDPILCPGEAFAPVFEDALLKAMDKLAV